jgi:L-seryl-tRNA(Ser) seleniumtransferase
MTTATTTSLLAAAPADCYRHIGVTPVIAACGATTAVGGSKLRPEVMAAMNAAAGIMVELEELNRRSGALLAAYTGAEAGLVCSGSAGGLVLQAAAVVAGSDPAQMVRLPNTDGMKNEIIIHRAHRFPYDQSYRSVGARFIEIGDGRRCRAWELEAAFSERTAAVAYLFSPYITRNALPLTQVCAIAHARGVPVIVNAASFLPPRANLRRFTAEGADMVVYSGGKAVRGPQGSGILVGKKTLIDAARANASPNQFFGRALKVAKEEIIGLLAALELFVNEDEAAETARYRAMCERAAQALDGLPGLHVSICHDALDHLTPRTVLRFTEHWGGRSRDTIRDAMIQGAPRIYLHDIFDPRELAIDPFNVDDEELEIVIRRLREELEKRNGSAARKT